ncbi:putative C-type lectin domain family 20 member A [Triplophysa rosa]|uniref:Secretory phospholipase A2 receptor-like n=1 Tax=Triplophysa rosa TaxID=992332 RepID=A0A9W7X2H9_TRIRA|nr:putative C-type lectin domain family 20 member A [Triplophysa rosa]KAI7812813.1 putative secretory phospholipase A2 receptor-like [Triplophysa rosa]
MKIPLSVLLLTALGELVSALIREHFYVNSVLTWFQAQTYCRTYYTDLSTFSCEEEYLRFLNTKGYQRNGWIGLYKEPSAVLYDQWSDGNPITYTLLLQNPTANYAQCVYVSVEARSWEAVDCFPSVGPFFCYQVSDLILVTENKSWEKALDYCRENYIDLASLSSQTDLLAASKTVNGITVNVWTSLRFLAGVWFWINGETLDSQLVMSLPSCPIPPDHCGARNFVTNRWELRDCDEKLYFFCYTEKEASGVSNTKPVGNGNG